MNVDCEDIGMMNGIDTCEGVVYVSDYIWVVIGVVLGLILICCCGFLYFRFRRISAEKPENKPRFIRSNGEMNHSMDLLEKAFTSKRPITPTSSRDDTDEE